jgi:serine/threonine protein phosphatase PrpC
MRYPATAKTHVGKRENNEDVYLFMKDLFVVADGIGGHASGEVASTMAAAVIQKAIELLYDLPVGRALQDAVTLADQVIRKRARQKEHLNMGTTVVALFVKGSKAAIVHAGDSRCYRLRLKGKLEQLTKDHSDGTHIIHRSLGCSRVEIGELRELTVAVGDVFLLCSDGLNVLPEEKIEEILRRGGAAEDLVNAAIVLDAARQDNVTAIVMRVTEGAGDPHEEDPSPIL